MPKLISQGHPIVLGRRVSVSAPAVGGVIFRSLDDLKPNPNNARTHPKRKIKDLAKAIKAFGFIGAIVIDKNGMILAGHARYYAARWAAH